MDGKFKKQQRRIPDVRYAPPDRLGPSKESKNLPAKYEYHGKYKRAVLFAFHFYDICCTLRVERK